ncbi:MAG TPA: NADH-quinone oxidoreductase subunit F, partial [Gammaproteobacteria bacterium]|nr:NADH-quinone oxidoreductase subunit F [Gammaproteobacteria bacterium]
MTTVSNEAKSRRHAGRGKGRAVSPAALMAVRDAISDLPRRRDLLIEYLHRLQDREGHIAADRMVALAEELKLAPAEIYEVATFYHHFDVFKEGDALPALTVRVCDSVTCELFGANQLFTALSDALDGRVRVQRVPCVGRCDQAPVAVVGQRPVPRAKVATVKALVDDGRQAFELSNDWIGLADYRKQGGYLLYQQCHDGTCDPEVIISALESSGLRGLGGAGFPAGRKWRILKEQSSP